ncbi:MAG: alpha/beta hydrolase [Firmicutes bacterium]|nr:alpha/beta hydrolase [Bacillota bacterium]
MYEFQFLSSNGKAQIHAYEWLPETSPKGILQIVHGLAEHMVRYGDFASFMARNGYIVIGHDQLGHGKSIGSADDIGFFGEPGGWELAVGDVRRMTELSHEQHPGLPLYLLGHSLGSLLARTYIIKYHQGLDGVLISGTGQLPPPLVSGGEVLAKLEIRRHGPRYKSKRLNDIAYNNYNSRISPKRTEKDWLSRDEIIVDRYVSDPLCGFVPSAALFLDMLHGMRYNAGAKNLKRMKKELPVLFFSGDMDPFGDYGKGVIHVYRSFLAAGMRDVSLKLYHEDRHETLNELNREEVYADVLTWIENKAGRK